MTHSDGKQSSRPVVSAVLKAGLLAGTLDIVCAMTHYYIRSGKNPANVLYFIASGVFDKAAFSGGAGMAMWGLFFHFFIAFSWTIFFFTIYPRVSWLPRNKIVSGFALGVLIWLVMNRIVVPLSNTPKIPFDFIQVLIGVVILMFAVGLPIVWITNKYYSNKSK